MNARLARVFALAAIVLLLAALGAFLSRRGAGSGRRSSSGAGGAHYTNETVYATWDKFVSSKEWKRAEKSTKPKVVFIGTDGATWNIVDSLIAEGVLPNFERIKKEGAFGILRSGECYVSPPAWVSMMTGYRPEHTGIYTFGIWDELKREFVSYSSEDVAVPYVWDIASLAGRKVAVTNMTVTYPARHVNGIMVTGLLTPIMIDESRPRFEFRVTPVEEEPGESAAGPSYSPVLEASFSLFTNEVVLRLHDSVDDGVERYDYGTVSCTPSAAARGSTAKVDYRSFPLNRYSPWLKLDFRKHRKQREGWCQLKVGTGKLPVCEVQVSAVYFSPDDPDVHYTYPEDFGKTIKDTFEYYFPYTPFDSAQVPEFTEDAVRYATFFYEYDDWDLFTYVFYETDKSQHYSGFSESTRSVYRTIDRYVGRMIDRLTDDDYLVIASDHGFNKYAYVLDLNKFFADIGLLEWNADGAINHSGTVAFYNMWAVYYNHALLTAAELKRRGIEMPPGASPRDALTAYIAAQGKAIADAGTGRPFPVDFVGVPDGAAGTPPDLIVTGTYDGYMVEFWDMKNPHTSVVRQFTGNEPWDHERDGVFLAYGNGVRRGYDAGTKDIQDVAPTLLYMMGLPLSPNLDGRVMEDLFMEDRLVQNPVAIVRTYPRAADRGRVQGTERDDLEKKLRNLGYVR